MCLNLVVSHYNSNEIFQTNIQLNSFTVILGFFRDYIKSLLWLLMKSALGNDREYQRIISYRLNLKNKRTKAVVTTVTLIRIDISMINKLLLILPSKGSETGKKGIYIYIYIYLSY